MAKVIKRYGTSYQEGMIIHDDHPCSYEEAERISGKKLDRRKNYAIIKGRVFESGSWSRACSGCYEGFYSNAPNERGSGCYECGYTGRSIESMWLPIKLTEMEFDE